MIKFAFCYEHDDTLNFVKNEVQSCLRQREVEIAAVCCHNAYELAQRIRSNCPDILFCDLDKDDAPLRSTILNVKRANNRLICISTRASSGRPHAEDVLLEPLFIMPELNRKHLWSYAALAYEKVLDEPDSFTYYVRPSYIRIPVHEIRYFASEGRRTHIVSAEYRDIFYQKLDVVEDLMCQKNCRFMRIHKSYLVNASFIAGFSRDYVLLTTGEQLRISKYEYYQMLTDQLKNLKNTKLRHHPSYSEW
ncbi:MAG: LytTR family transcriptional regulator [Lachnospiraceae bacterium]|nr:LytTR family transcriptional regulator [Lachnospiraceae bacterium]